MLLVSPPERCQAHVLGDRQRLKQVLLNLLSTWSSTTVSAAGIPVVVLSADARPGLIQRLLEQGARVFLTKPLDVKELLELLDAVAAERQEAIAAGQASSS